MQKGNSQAPLNPSCWFACDGRNPFRTREPLEWFDSAAKIEFASLLVSLSTNLERIASQNIYVYRISR